MQSTVGRAAVFPLPVAVIFIVLHSTPLWLAPVRLLSFGQRRQPGLRRQGTRPLWRLGHPWWPESDVARSHFRTSGLIWARAITSFQRACLSVMKASNSAELGGDRAISSSPKGGALAWAKSCAIDFAPFGITVNAASPSSIETSQMEKLHHKLTRDGMVNATSMTPYGRSAEAADGRVFLSRDDAPGMTGHDLVIEGEPKSAAVLYDLSTNPQPV